MNFFQLLILGYKNYWRGIQFLIKHKLYWFVVFPLILFVGVYWLGYYFAGLEGSVGRDIQQMGADIDSLNGLIWMTNKMIFFDSLYIVFTKFTLYIVVIILSPILSIISEKIEEILTGNKYPFNLKQLISDVKRGMRIAMRNIFWEYLFFIVILGLAQFLGGGAKKVIIFSLPMIIGFYFYGFAFIDYINERRRLNIQQSIFFVSKHKGLAVAIGSIYSIFFLSYNYVFRSFDSLPSDTATQLFWGTILVITFALATVAPILAITSATLSMHDVVDLGKNEYAIKKSVLTGDTADDAEGSPANDPGDESRSENSSDNEEEKPN